METETKDDSCRPVRREWLFWLLAGLLTLAFFFRQTILTGFDLGLGGIGDARLMMFLMEHWWLVAQGEVLWNQPLYFHGAEGILATTDTFFMQGLIYVPLRAAGLGMFAAWHGVWLTWAAIGFGGMGWLLRRELRLPLAWSIAGSAFFIIANPTYLIPYASHLQLLSVWMVPLLVVFGIRIVQNWNSPSGRLYGWAVAFALLYGLLALSTFYIVWMATFYACLAGVVWYLSRAVFIRLTLQQRRIDASLGLRSGPRPWLLIRQPRAWILLGIFLACLLPFLGLYLPLRLGDGGWPFKVVFELLPAPRHWFNPGEGSWLYAGGFDSHAQERQYGHTPLVWIGVIGLSLWILFRPAFKGTWLRVVVLTNLLLFFLLTRFGDTSIWEVVFHLVPGGDVIRAPFRVAHILYATFPVLLAWGGARLSGVSRPFSVLAAVLCLFVLLEQVNTLPIANQSRSKLHAYLESVSAPPEDARAFAILPENPASEAPFILQTRAMMLALDTGIPTINGLTGRFPDDFYHFDTHKATYPAAAESWAFRHGFSEWCYWYDEAQGKWRSFDGMRFGDWEEYRGKNLVHHPLQPRIFLSGFSMREDWGVWSEGPQSRIILPAMSFPTQLEIDWFPFLPETSEPLEVRASLDGVKVGEWHFPGAPERIVIPVSPATRDSQHFRALRIDYHDPRSPDAFDQNSGDTRELAIGYRSLVLSRKK